MRGRGGKGLRPGRAFRTACPSVSTAHPRLPPRSLIAPIRSSTIKRRYSTKQRNMRASGSDEAESTDEDEE